MESSSGVGSGIIGVTVCTIVGAIVGHTVIAEVGESAVVKSLGFFTLSFFLQPLIINNNTIIKAIITNLFFFTINTPWYAF